jgi:hypothetical protein
MVEARSAAEGETVAPGVRLSEVCMRLGSEERLVASRAVNASREVVRSRQHVDAARRSLELAIEMYCGAEGEAAPILALEQVLAQLEEAGATLWETSQ